VVLELLEGLEVEPSLRDNRGSKNPNLKQLSSTLGGSNYERLFTNWRWPYV